MILLVLAIKEQEDGCLAKEVLKEQVRIERIDLVQEFQATRQRYRPARPHQQDGDHGKGGGEGRHPHHLQFLKKQTEMQ